MTMIRSPWQLIIDAIEASLDALWVIVVLRSPWRSHLFQQAQALSFEGDHQSPDLCHRVQQTTYGLAVAERLYSPLKPLTCLERALVQQRMLRRRGISAKLRVGVQTPEGNPLQVHAWLEHPLLPRDALSDSYQPLQPQDEQ